MPIQINRCPELEDTLKRIPGLRLGEKPIAFMEAIDNEGGKSVNVWLNPRDQRVLMPIGRCLDRRYGGLNWILKVDISDMEDDFVLYHLQSRTFDDEAIEESKQLAKMLDEFMDDKNTLEHFGLNEIFHNQLIIDTREYREKNIEKILGNQ